MRTIEEIRAELSQYKKYEDVPKELRKEYNEISLQMIQQEECERYRRYEITKDIPLDRLEEICNAELDGRCVVLPCKVGDTVYVIYKDRLQDMAKSANDQPPEFYRVLECKIDTYLMSKDKQVFYAESDVVTIVSFSIEDFGKTVFPTPEEAEQALKGLNIE